MRSAVLAFVSAATCALSNAHAAGAVSVAGVDEIFKPFTQASTPGCSVGVFEKGRPLLMRGYGVADILSNAPLREETLFYAASTSKQFTALSIALLAQDGKLRLDDDVRRHVPEMPDYGTPLTLAMLLHHTSGLGDYLGLFDLAGTDHYEKLDPKTVLAMIVRQKGVQFTPGTEYRYSNTGYFLLAETVARVSGQSFPEFVRSRILAPLGMRDSFMRSGAVNPPKAKVAHGYVTRGEGFEVRDTYPAFGGSGGLMTSIRDLQKFDRDFTAGHKAWPDAVRKIMLTPATFSDGTPVTVEGLGYAAGLHVGQLRGLQWVSHSGAAAAFRSEYVRLPQKSLGIAVLCNRGDVTPGLYVQRVIDTLGLGALPGQWPGPRQRRNEDREPAGEPLTPAMVKALQGRYRSDELAADYVLTAGGDGALTGTIESQYAQGKPAAPFGALRMQPRDQLFGEEGYSLQLERAPDGRITAFWLSGGDMRSLRFIRVP